MMKRHSLVTYLLPCLMLTACAQTAMRDTDTTEPEVDVSQPSDMSATELSAAPEQAATDTDTDTTSASETTAAAAADAEDAVTASAPSETTPEEIQPAATAAPEPTELELAAKLLPLPPQEIVATVDKLVKHPRVQWLSGIGQYSYYVGGRLNALYDPKAKVFTINSDRPTDNPVSCQYASDGSIMSPAQDTNPGTESTCTQMINELTSFLSR